jgi:hypothetical protein
VPPRRALGCRRCRRVRWHVGRGRDNWTWRDGEREGGGGDRKEETYNETPIRVAEIGDDDGRCSDSKGGRRRTGDDAGFQYKVRQKIAPQGLYTPPRQAGRDGVRVTAHGA